MGDLSDSDFCASHPAKLKWYIASCPTQGQAHIKFLDILGILTTYEDEHYDHDDEI